MKFRGGALLRLRPETRHRTCSSCFSQRSSQDELEPGSIIQLYTQILERVCRAVGRRLAAQVLDRAAQPRFEAYAQFVGVDAHNGPPSRWSRRSRTMFESKQLSAMDRAARAWRSYAACTSSIASTATSVVSKWSSPSPVGSQWLKPVSCAITRPPGGQITHALVTEPAAARNDVAILGYSQLGP